jgi:hypothetical protein
MAPSLRIDVSPTRIRAELSPAGIVLEDDPAVAIMYDADKKAALILAVGRDALAIPDRLRDLDLTKVPARQRSMRIVDVEAAPWMSGPSGERPLLNARARARHHGEIVVFRPFESARFDPLAATGLLRYFAVVAQRKLPAREQRGITIRQILGAYPIDLRVDRLPDDDRAHDAFVASLGALGRNVRLQGERPTRKLPRPMRDVGLRAGILAAIAAIVALQYLHPPAYFVVANISVAAFFGGAAIYKWVKSREDLRD